MRKSSVCASNIAWSLGALGLLVAPTWGQNTIFRQSTATSITETMDGTVCVAAGDVDKDGKPVIVVGSHEGVLLLLASGNGHFEPGKRLLADSADAFLAMALYRTGRIDAARKSLDRARRMLNDAPPSWRLHQAPAVAEAEGLLSGKAASTPKH